MKSLKKKNLRKHNPLYSVYNNIKKRCFNKNYYYFHRYGGRDINICARWLGNDGFANFIEDMGTRPKGTQIDRINNNGNYEPKNCRWANKYEQMSNISTNNKFIGVGWHSQRKKYRARIKIKGREISLGLYKNINDAIEARSAAYSKLCSN